MKIKYLDKILAFFLFSSLVIYSCMYIMVNMGYYEYSNYKKKNLTEQQIKKFENDIKQGKDIDISLYIDRNDDMYKKPKRLLAYTSEIISKSTKKCIVEMFKMLNKFVEN